MANISVSDKLKDNYDGYYEGESEWRRLSAIGKAQNIVSLCKPYQHAAILEIGSGEGAILQRLSELGFGERYWALEISHTAVETIRQRTIPELVECQVFDGYSVPYADKQFDLAILSHVVEHVEYPRKLLYEASRVARYVFVEVPLEHTMRLGADFVFDSVGHINFYSPKTIRHLVQTCNLDVLRQTITNQSYEVYRYRSGKSALLKYWLKQSLLRFAPRAAVQLFTYHCSLLCADKHTQP